jgi:hypothetical protein
MKSEDQKPRKGNPSSSNAHAAACGWKELPQQHNNGRKVLLTNCYIVFGGFELPESDIDGNTTLTLGL